MLTQAPKGTLDILPSQSAVWHYMEEAMRHACAVAGYREARTPVFEHTELFQRGVGDTTDIVQKEMYTFLDKGGRSVTLKPEGTAGVARAFIEHGLCGGPLPLKIYYVYSPVFRYEKPQAGRYREHHQFGLEVFGAAEPTMDAEVIALPWKLLEGFGLNGLTLKLNSIGCPNCRPQYLEVLREYLRPKLPGMCGTCQGRFERNPLRILDCKVEECQRLIGDAPNSIDYLCEACADHFEQTQQALRTLGIEPTLDSRLVRGLDYYTRTVFEVHPPFEGTPTLALFAGGRYDLLIEQLGGPATAGIGFGMGMERIASLLTERNLLPAQKPVLSAMICTLGDEARLPALKLAHELRDAGISADCDHTKRSLKAQMKYANRMEVPIVLVLGGDELAGGVITLRDMKKSEERTVAVAEAAAAVKALLEEAK